MLTTKTSSLKIFLIQTVLTAPKNNPRITPPIVKHKNMKSISKAPFASPLITAYIN